jgi:hypothetical protein
VGRTLTWLVCVSQGVRDPEEHYPLCQPTVLPNRKVVWLDAQCRIHGERLPCVSLKTFLRV